MTKKREHDGHDDRAPTAAIDDDATERHLLKSRELLRQARSRLLSRDDSAASSNRGALNQDDGEDSND